MTILTTATVFFGDISVQINLKYQSELQYVKDLYVEARAKFYEASQQNLPDKEITNIEIDKLVSFS